MAIFLLAIGNMMSMKNPRPVDPGQSWRKTSAGKVQAMLLFIYALVSAPVALAYGARYAFESNLAFYGVLAFDIAIGTVVYWIAMDSALDVARTSQGRHCFVVVPRGRASGIGQRELFRPATRCVVMEERIGNMGFLDKLMGHGESHPQQPQQPPQVPQPPWLRERRRGCAGAIPLHAPDSASGSD